MFFGLQRSALLDQLKERSPATVEDLVPDQLSVGDVQRVLQLLLVEGVPIRDLVTILETLGDKARVTKDVPILAEYCRQALARVICNRYVDAQGTLRAITLDPDTDREIAESVMRTEEGSQPTISPERLNELLEVLSMQVDAAQSIGAPPVVLCSAATRRHLKALTVHALPSMAVLSYNEILPDVRIEPVGMAGVA